ncbi:unnamed protein product [Ectocarpus sp. 12 AP-2014]
MKLAWQSVLLLPVLVVVTQAQSTCSDGIEGIDGNGVVCCPLECGQCGGTGCSNFGAEFGLGSESCCGGGVKATSNYCDVTGEAPCIYGSPPAGAVNDRVRTRTTGGCSGGIEGIDGKGVVCCPLECGQCGGTGCSSAGAASGLGSESCCESGVNSSGRYCDITEEAPCIYGNPDDGESFCSNGPEGIDGNGVVCSPLECGACGGLDCGTSGRDFGLGSESCCGGGIIDSGIMCFDSRAAPGVAPGPTPTTPTPNPSPTPIMTIPTSCTSSQLPTFRYAASSGKVGKGRLCEWLLLLRLD